jgi:tellurite resistance protein TerC
MSADLTPWIVFVVAVAALLAIDLGVLGRRGEVMSTRVALLWSAMWIGLGLSFSLAVWGWRGPVAAQEYLAGYLIEESLSIDNLFVFLLIFTYFSVPPIHQHKILFWGIFGAIVMRVIFITGGITLLHYFHWIFYVFGAFLLFTGFKLFRKKGRQVDPSRNPFFKLFGKFIPVTSDYEDGHFLVSRAGKLMATPMLVVLFVIESTDVMFAVDSVPAVLAISTDAFIVISSNIFAILGLRALFFVLARAMALFHYLHYGLAIILAFIGVKMLIADIYDIPALIALLVLVAVLTVSIVASLLFPEQKKGSAHAADQAPPAV